MMIDLSKNENTSYKLDVSNIVNSVETNRYSFENNYKLHEALANKYNLKPDNFILGCGSSDVIFMFMLMLNEKAKLENKQIDFIVPKPTFYVIVDFARALNMNIKPIILGDDFKLDVHSISCSNDRINLIYICNPNNPTAQMLSKSDLEYLNDICNNDTYFILDEAYSEFVEDFNTIKMASNSNVLHARTMSKIYSLAGLRLGYGIACEKTIEKMSAFYNPDRINSFALYGAIYALNNVEFLNVARDEIRKNRLLVENEFKKLNIKYYPSQTNFILHEIKDINYRTFMKEQGILVGGAIENYPLLNRISIGNKEEIQAYIKALRLAKDKNLV
ncbi:pyridoxal phosphate-dependent aminotransferase [Campylobacter sp. MG1]|uniref:pyridoxal phosphate-dependent aminotransferase n=1 Tax=Campylobacter sp. MG1 TaxID=2976332 RepID=UPI00226CF4CE|nr:histidinol-phosphate transaminase [Campylobacter sp. MG1]